MDKELIPYSYLWEELGSYMLLTPNSQYPDYSILNKSTLELVWIEDLRLRKMVIQQLLRAGVQVVNEKEFLDLRVQAHNDLWKANERDYVLVRVERGLQRYDILNLQRGTTLRVEDRTLREAIIARMIEEGVAIVDQEEADRIVREG